MGDRGMDAGHIYAIVTLASLALTIVISFWLIRRAQPKKRIHWFIGASIVSIIWLGIYIGPIAIISTLALLFVAKSEHDHPLSDVRDGALGILGSGFSLALYALYMLLLVGGVYWLWIAIQLKSFTMFLVGLFPLFYIVTAPVGAYSLVFHTPQWVISWFG